MIDKVYVIYTGCKYEGGGIGNNAYKSKDDAVKELLEIKNREEEDLFDENGNFLSSLDKSYSIYKEIKYGHWETNHDVLRIIELSLM